MNLFSQQENDDVARLITPGHKSWSNLISMQTANKIDNILSELKPRYDLGVPIFPGRGNIFRALTIPANEVKVVILGQDPYPDENANGFAFSCNVSLSYSLRIIFGNIKDNLRRLLELTPNGELEGRKLNWDITLKHWVESKVFLLNTILTVGSAPLSHANLGWQDVTTEIIKILARQPQPVVWMLWGKQAQNYERYIINPKHLILHRAHPASVRHSNIPWKHDDFVRCNEYLIANKTQPVIWI